MKVSGKITVKYAWLLIVGLVLCVGCGSKENEAQKNTLQVYRYEDFPIQKAEMLCAELRKYFPEVELVDTVLVLPSEAYMERRNRYSGTGLLKDLRKFQKSNMVLGLTNRIICTSNEISPDFGIMGISYLKCGLSIVSDVIPKTGRQQTDENLIKLTLHELGHALGLPHCPDQKCYMVDAEHRMKLPNTTGFCENCREFLKSVGVNVANQ